MYGATLPQTGAGLMIGSVAVGVMQLAWLAVAMAVVGGALITVSKFAPRYAIEPRVYGVNGRRWAFVKNGQVVRWLGRGR